MKIRNVNFYQSALLLLCFLYAGSIMAQRLPNIQENSQWLPATTQIDGKLSEWNGLLQASNKAIIMEYTIANSDKELYLAIRSKDKTTTAKILAGGVSFILNTAGKSNVNESAIVTVPATNSAYFYTTEGIFSNFKTLEDSVSIKNAIVGLKEIKAIRLKGVSDSILSVYNEYGIKSRLAYTNETLICELSIPFDRIGLSEESAAFAYNIRLNGVPLPPARRPPTVAMPGQRVPPRVVLPPGSVDGWDIQVPTYFGGKYTLARK